MSCKQYALSRITWTDGYHCWLADAQDYQLGRRGRQHVNDETDVTPAA